MKLRSLLLTVSLSAVAQPPAFEIYPFVGNPTTPGFPSLEGPATQAQFLFAQSFFIGSGGDSYFRDGRRFMTVRLTNGELKYHSANADQGLRFIVGNDGAVYALSGSHDSIRRTDPKTGSSTIWAGENKRSTADGTSIQDADIRPTTLALGPDGLVYFSDQPNHRIRRVSADGRLETVAGSGTEGDAQVGALAFSAPLSYPTEVSLDSQGRVYFLSSRYSRIYRVNSQRRVELLVDASELYKIPAFTPPAGWSSGIALAQAAPNGGVYFLDRGLRQIVLRTELGTFVAIAGRGRLPFQEGRLATDVRLCNVNQLQVDPQNRVVIACSDLKQFYRIDTDGRLRVVAGRSGGYGDGGPATQAALVEPQDLSIGANGDVYVHDEQANRVRAVDSTGTIRTAAGTGMQVFSNPCVPAPAAESDIGHVYSMTADSQGNIWTTHAPEGAICLSDSRGNLRQVLSSATYRAQTGSFELVAFDSTTIDRQGNLIAGSLPSSGIWRITPQGQVTRLAGLHLESGISPDGVPANRATLRMPRGVAVGPDGLVYFTESGRNIIRYIDANGILRSLNTPTGTGEPRNGDRFATAVAPEISEIAWDREGLLYFVGGFTQIYRVERDGTVWRIAGVPTGTQNYSSTGPALNVAMYVMDIAIDANGNLYASDLNYRRVFKMQASAGPRLAAAGGMDQTGPAGRSLGTPVKVAILWPSKTPLIGELVQFQVISGDARISYQERKTDAKGEAWTYVTLGPTPGPAVIRASSATYGSAEFTVYATAAVSGIRPVLFEESMVGAGFSDPPMKKFSANGLVTVFGEDLAPPGTMRVLGYDDLNGLQVPGILADVCVEVNSARAPMLLVTPSQINFVFPSVGIAGTARVRLLRNCSSSTPAVTNELTVELAERSSELLSFGTTADGKRLAAAISARTGELIAPPGAIPGVVTRPARYFEPITLFAVGLGETRPVTSPGQIRVEAAALSRLIYIFSPTLSIGNILYAGIAPGFSGLYQINVSGHYGEKNELVEILVSSDPEGRSASVYLAVTPDR